MEENLKNNLFSYATSELSQDAFICYLLSFAYKDYYDPILTPCAKELIHLFVKEIDKNELKLIDIRKQYPITIHSQDGRRTQKRSIDIFLTVQCREICYKIIVEDKTFTSEHDKQLETYKEKIEEEFPLPVYHVKCVYYKTGFQSNVKHVEEAGYHIVGRKEILDLLEKYIAKTDNYIVRDYCYYWQQFQREVDLFKVLPPANWTWKQINGFYDDLQHSIKNVPVGYGDVSNPSGGFVGFWTIAQDQDTIRFQGVGLDLYLQIEASEKEKGNTTLKICLKIATKEESINSENLTCARNMLIYREKQCYRFSAYGFERPKINSGKTMKTMTVGIMSKDYHTAEDVKNAFLEAIKQMKLLISDIKSEYNL